MAVLKISLSKLMYFVVYFEVIYISFYGLFSYVFPYSRFILTFILISLIFLVYLKSGFNISKITFTFIFFLYFLIGVYNFGLNRSLYGFYIFNIFIFSLMLNTEVLKKIFLEKMWFWLLIFLSNVLGVLYVDKFGASWVGVEQTTFGISREVSKDWMVFEVFRNPGFTNSSVSVACILSLSATILGRFLVDQRKFLSLILLNSVLFYTLVLTTTKTAIFSSIFIFILLLLPFVVARVFLKILFFIIFFTTCFYTFFYRKLYSGSDSIFIRFYDMWPKIFDIFPNEYAYIIGSGYGGVGAPSLEYNNYHPGDSFIVYMYAIFGISFIILLFYYCVRILKNDFFSFNDKIFSLVFILILLSSYTYNVVELPLYALFFGFFLKSIYANRVL